ncbi:hypothetical protein M9H77_21743 [Catharanthus roseus]|uniref:Uncharacterized protein n=1 Tax=Catharanthus roseus TaxID=4058 RepID=A0ACC0AQ87_CATRO|nr:hypothetical protein M9H77_21743 [Catharanthus roseus]
MARGEARAGPRQERPQPVRATSSQKIIRAESGHRTGPAGFDLGQEAAIPHRIIGVPLGNTEINAVNYLSHRSWLATSHFVLGFFFFVGHLWHTGRLDLIEGSNGRTDGERLDMQLLDIHQRNFAIALTMRKRRIPLLAFKSQTTCNIPPSLT